MISGNAYAMPWLKEVPAILQAWYGGTESGNAIASVLFGKTNPSVNYPLLSRLVWKIMPLMLWGLSRGWKDGRV